jgi:type IV fimbrial biogenesis protein FimT
MRKDAPGFTLLECVTSIAVVAILCGLALPGFSEALRRQRTATAMHLLSAHVALARNTAVMRAQPVTLCPSSGDGRCRADADWSQGWLMYADPRRRDQPGQASDILRELREPLHPSVRIYSSTSRPRIRYQPDGRSGGSNLTLRVCIEDGLVGEVIINNVGRARTRRPDGPAPCPGTGAGS